MTRVDAYPASVAARDMPEDSSNQLGFRELFDIIARKWILIASITVAVTILVVGATFVMTKLYTATLQLKIDPSTRIATDPTLPRMTSPQADDAHVDTEVQVLQSRRIVVNVVRELHLDQDPEFTAPSTLSALLHPIVNLINPHGPIGPEDAFNNVVDAVSNNLTVKRESDNYIVDVGFRSQNPEKSARIVNAFANHYLHDNTASRTSVAGEQAQFLDQRLRSLGGEISALEGKAAEYRGASGIVQGGTLGTITDQQVAPLTAQLASAEAAAAAAHANLSAAREQIAHGNGSSVSSVLSSNTIIALRAQLAEASKDQAQINARYGDKHPESIRAAQQIASIETALREEAQRIVSGLDATARAADASAGSLRSQLGQLRGQQAVDTRAGVSADALERQAKAKQVVYDQLAQTAQQTDQAQLNTESAAQVVNYAVPPVDPSSPKRALFAALGVILGLIVGLSTALLIEFFTNTVHKGDDIERSLGMPFLTSVPRLSARQLREPDGSPLAPADYVLQNPMSTFAESLRTIRSSLLLASGDGPKVLAILSALPGEGKTSVSLALARIMALAGDRVLLIDCDLRRGGLNEFAAPGGGSLTDVLSGAIAPAEAIVRDLKSNLDLLPVHGPSFTAVDLFSGERMKALLRNLVERYDFVLLDNAPVLAVADARIIASLADMSLFVVRAENTPLRAARAAVNMLRQDGSVLFGGALTMTERAKRLGQNDPAYFYSRYRSYHQG